MRRDHQLNDDAKSRADSICDEVLPREGMTKNQMPEGGISNADDPWGLVEFECFYAI